MGCAMASTSSCCDREDCAEDGPSPAANTLAECRLPAVRWLSLALLIPPRGLRSPGGNAAKPRLHRSRQIPRRLDFAEGCPRCLAVAAGCTDLSTCLATTAEAEAAAKPARRTHTIYNADTPEPQPHAPR